MTWKHASDIQKNIHAIVLLEDDSPVLSRSWVTPEGMDGDTITYKQTERWLHIPDMCYSGREQKDKDITKNFPRLGDTALGEKSEYLIWIDLLQDIMPNNSCSFLTQTCLQQKITVQGHPT